MNRLDDTLKPSHRSLESPAMRAAKLRVRMAQFKEIYNAAWFLRAAQHGSPAYRQERTAAMMAALRQALENCQDDEALFFAIADALTADSRLPWEG